jgi:DNA-directed RNA polymerase
MTNQSPSWQASQDRFNRGNKLRTSKGRRIYAPRTEFGATITSHLIQPLAALFDGRLPVQPLPPPNDLGPALYSLGSENLAFAALAPIVDGVMRGWDPGPDRKRRVCERMGRFIADSHEAFESTRRTDRIAIGNWLLYAVMMLDAFDIDAAGYPTFSEEFQPSVEAIRDNLIRLRHLLLPHTIEPKPWGAWRTYYDDNLSATFVQSTFPETRALISEAFRNPEWEHPRGINALQKVPFTIDPVILDLVDRFAVKIMDRAGKKRLNDHRTVNSDLDTAKFLLGEQFWLSYRCDWRGRLIPNQQFNFAREDHVRSMFRFANGARIDAEARYWLKVHAANSHAETDKEWFGDRVAWADNNRSLIERIAADPVATFQEWRDVDKPFAFVAACRELVSALNDPNFETHLPISFDGRANGIAHMAMIAKDRAAAQMVNLLESNERRDIYSEIAAELRKRGLWQCFADLTDKQLRALVKKPVMTYGYSVTEEGMWLQIGEEYIELTGSRAPKGASSALTKQIEEIIAELLPGPARIRERIRAITQSRTDEGKFLQWKTPTGFPVCNRYEESLVTTLELKMHKKDKNGLVLSRFRPKVADGHTGEILEEKALNGSAPNFVQSLDASHLIRVVLAANGENISDILTVHDSYACLAPHAVRFNQIIRIELAKMYKTYDPIRALGGGDIALGDLDPLEVQFGELSWS